MKLGTCAEFHYKQWTFDSLSHSRGERVGTHGREFLPNMGLLPLVRHWMEGRSLMAILHHSGIPNPSGSEITHS